MKLLPEDLEESDRILEALRKVSFGGGVARLLRIVPDQDEDFYFVLIDDLSIVRFVLSRYDRLASAEEITVLTIPEYQKNLRGRGARDFKAFIKEVRRETAERRRGQELDNNASRRRRR